MNRLSIRLAAVLSLVLTNAAVAQVTRSASDRWLENCRDGRYSDDERFCEIRNSTVAVTRAIKVDARQNGGATVHGWDKNEIQVVARVQGNAQSQRDAEEMVKAVSISTNGGEIRADGPSTGRHENWSVSYEIWVPRHTEIQMYASNGGLSVDGLESRIDLQTQNGGITLTDVNGDVRGHTQNGGVTADLSGPGWRGAGLDLQTSNGSVRVTIPASYSARLETGTTNGGLNIDFPIMVQGTIGRQVTTQLGNGGPTIRAMTTNGSVTIRKG